MPLHDNLATIRRAKLRGAHEHSRSPPVYENLDPNEQGSHQGLLVYNNNGWKCELDGTDFSIVKFSSKS